MKKLMGLVFLSLFFALAIPFRGFGTCHNDSPCEDPYDDLIFYEKWGNQPVWYYTDPYIPPGLPGWGDVHVAANTWRGIMFGGQFVNFDLSYGGNYTAYPAGIKDGVSVVGWGLPEIESRVAETVRWLDPNDTVSPFKIIEVDTIFNYYEPFAQHQTPGVPGKYCLRNVATHEFGHWVRLNHVSKWDCPAYGAYTMSSDYGGTFNYHEQEYLACEDKWGAWYTCNQLGPPAPPIPIFPTTTQAEGVEKTRLHQNYPDPFNPDTWIPYELKEDANVLLEIHDSQGYLVRKLVLGRKPRGRYVDQKHAASWDGRDEKGALAPSGVYFYTLKANDFSATRKMILLK